MLPDASGAHAVLHGGTGVPLALIAFKNRFKYRINGFLGRIN